MGPKKPSDIAHAMSSRTTSDRSAQRDRKVVRILATIGVPVAIMFHGGVGALVGVVAARPLWNSGLFPILFLVSALASGGALLIVGAAIFQHGWTPNRETVLALGRLGWTLRRIEEETGIRRETVSTYLKAAGIVVRPERGSK